MITPEIVNTLVSHLLDFVKMCNARADPSLIEVEGTLKVRKRRTILSRPWLPEEKWRLNEAYPASDQHPQSLKA